MASLRSLRGRVRRRPLLVGVAVVAVVSGLAVFALGARPDVDVLNAVPVERGYVGTTYAFDGLLCVGSQVTATTVTGVEVDLADGATTRLVRPPQGSPPTVGFPVEDEGSPVDGYEVPAGEPDCDLRLLVTPTRTGDVRAAPLRLSVSYGPGGLLRRTIEVRPDVSLSVTGTGTDPRSR
ncbi:MAG: hypothetical protein JWN08_1942 [Frankiales bacterium]|nr:hypothetical protein [Frankiales bacterium]